MMASDNSDCVTVRARVRKSSRAIDPEFDECRETLVSFVDGPPQRQKGGRGVLGAGKDGKCHSLLLTPVPTAPSSRARSLSRGSGSVPAASRRRHRSFGPAAAPGGTEAAGPHARKASTASLSSSEMSNGGGGEGRESNQQGASSTSDTDGMVDVSLEVEDEEGGVKDAHGQADGRPNLNPGPSGLDASARSNHSSHPILNPRGSRAPPVHPSHRYSSPISVFRTSSGVSVGGASSVVSSTHSDTHVAAMNKSARSQSVSGRSSSRSRSRSRSRRRAGSGGHLRMRSLGAASAFATAVASGQAAAEDEADKGGGTGSSAAAERLEPVSIPLGDVLSVDEEVPGMRAGRRVGSDAGAGASDFYSSAASDVGAAREAAAAGGDGRATTPRLSSPPPSSSTNGVGRGSIHRIFLHTLSHGYIEFSFDGSNSHDIFMAYLKAHLPPDRVPRRDGSEGSERKASGTGTALLRTMVLTPTKEVPSELGGPARDVGDARSASDPGAPSSSPSGQPRTLPRPGLTRSNSTMGSVNVDKLHSRAVQRRLREESTPLHRVKEQLAGWMSSLMDCACCQDTTVSPAEDAQSKSSLQATPESTRLRQQATWRGAQQRKQGGGGCAGGSKLCSKGIGGLSFEEMSCGTPKLSFERSVGGESKR